MISSIPNSSHSASSVSSDMGAGESPVSNELGSPPSDQVANFEKAMTEGQGSDTNTSTGSGTGNDGDTAALTGGQQGSEADPSVEGLLTSDGTVTQTADGDEPPLSPADLLAQLGAGKPQGDESDELDGTTDTLLGDALAQQGLGGTGTQLGTGTVVEVDGVAAPAGTLPTAMTELVEAIRVSDPTSVGGTEIVLQIKSDVMPDTSVSIKMVDGRLDVQINTGDVGSGMLAGHVDGLEAQLADVLGVQVDVSVNVNGSDVTAQLAQEGSGDGSNSDGSGGQGSSDQDSGSQDTGDQSADQHQPDNSGDSVIDEDGLVEQSQV